MPRCVIVAACGLALSAPALASASEPVYIEQLEPITVELNGRAVRVEPVRVWRFMCFDPSEGLTGAQLESAVGRLRQMRAEGETQRIGVGRRMGLDVVFDVSGTIPTAAPAALAFTTAYCNDLFPTDDVEVNVDFGFVTDQPFLGAAGSTFFGISYADLRTGLNDDADADDILPGLMPAGPAIDVFTGQGPTLNQIESVFLTTANYSAIFGDGYDDFDVGIVINSDFNLDYDASDGVGGDFSFLDIIIHEVGHALGMVSVADNDTADNAQAITPLDAFRFRGFDENPPLIINPEGAAEFTQTPRFVVADLPVDPDDNFDPGSENDLSIVDFIDSEYPMSDSTPRQASHFSDQTPAFALMDPTLAPGQTFAPGYFTTADRDAFDAIGWNRVTGGACSPADLTGDGLLNNADINAFVAAFLAGEAAADLTGDGLFNNADINAFVSLFLAGC